MKPIKDPEGFEKKYLHQYANFTDARVLEIGCGDGRLTWKYAFDTKQSVAFDPQLDELRLARADCPSDLRQRVSLVNASAFNIPHPKNTFDLAVLSWSL